MEPPTFKHYLIVNVSGYIACVHTQRSRNKYPFPKLQEKNKISFYSGKRLEKLGTDASTSPLQSERSTIWANPPAENLGKKSVNDKCFLYHTSHENQN